MHPADIQALIKKKGLTQKEIAKRLNKTEHAISKVVNKQSVSDEIMRSIAELLGKPVTTLFPEY